MTSRAKASSLFSRRTDTLNSSSARPTSFDTAPRLELKHLRQDDGSPGESAQTVVNEEDTPAMLKPDGEALVETQSEQPANVLDVRVPPDGGRIAWMQVFASFLINMNVYGLVNAFGDFQHYYETDYLASYSSSTISWIGTVQGSLTLFGGALAGPIFDKGYFMLTLRTASVTLVFSWMMLSLSTQYYQVRYPKL